MGEVRLERDPRSQRSHFALEFNLQDISLLLGTGEAKCLDVPRHGLSQESINYSGWSILKAHLY